MGTFSTACKIVMKVSALTKKNLLAILYNDHHENEEAIPDTLSWNAALADEHGD